MPSPPTRVVYLAGWGRSGSTLLELLLGQVPGFFSVGELVYLWSRGLGTGWSCGCGDPVSRCAVWDRVLSNAFADPEAVAAEMRSLERRLVRTRYLAGFLTGREPRGPRGTAYARYRDVLSALYRSIAEVTGARVIVDSSKLPAYGAVLDRLDDVELSVVHVVRDPRAVAYSWSTRGKNAGIAERIGVTKSTAYWGLFNVAVEALWARETTRYLRVRYEDLAAEPEHVFAQVTALVSEQPTETPFTGARTASVGAIHSVSGNPARFRTGAVDIAPDARWAGAMRRPALHWVTALALPLLSHYGYTLRPSAGAS